MSGQATYPQPHVYECARCGEWFKSATRAGLRVIAEHHASQWHAKVDGRNPHIEVPK